MPTPTFAEALADLERRGLKYQRIPGGHIIEGPRAVLRIFNAEIVDQLVYRDGMGTLNVSLAQRLLTEAGREPVEFPLGASMREHISKYEYDDRLVSGMSRQRRDEPLIFVGTVMAGGLQTDLIDGVHRLRRLMRDGAKSFKAHVIPSELLPRITVTRERLLPNGKWAPYPMTEAEVGLI